MRCQPSVSFMEGLEGRRLLATGSILFITGAVRSGGFIGPQNDTARTEQLSRIGDTSTAVNNKGWGQLAATLRAEGYTVTEIAETLEPGAPTAGQTQGVSLDLRRVNLGSFRAVVFGSNNALYSSRFSIPALVNYVQGGGAALFISDANFGSNWRDAADSDQGFLTRFGLTMTQDQASGVVQLDRAGGNFTTGTHPILQGITSIAGEGVSPAVISATPPTGVALTRVAGTKGLIRNNDGTGSSAGSTRAATTADASIVAGTFGTGRIAVTFDRNTFFNLNGTGTDIAKLDNRQFARNLFDWLTGNPVDAAPRLLDAPTVGRSLRFIFNVNVFDSLQKEDMRIINRDTGRLVDLRNIATSQVGTAGGTTWNIRFRDQQPGGRYEIRVAAGNIANVTGQTNPAEIRYRFSIPNVAGASVGSATVVPGAVYTGPLVASSGISASVFAQEENILA